MAAKKAKPSKKAGPKLQEGGAARAAGRKRVMESRNRQGIRIKQGPQTEAFFSDGGGMFMIPGKFGPMSPVERKAKSGYNPSRVLNPSLSWGRMPGERYAMPMRKKRK